MNNNKVNITWLDINSSYSHSSLALPAIEAQQPDNEKIRWAKVSGTINSVISTIVEDLLATKPDIIAYTAWLFTHDTLIRILARYKKLCPEVIIIGGGPEYLGNNHDFLTRNRFVDYVVRGEGEEVFYEWLNSSKAELKNIRGLCYLQDGEYIDNGIAKVENYEVLAVPENSRFFDWNKPFIQIESTRGCFNCCAFCVSGADKPVRSLSIDNLRKRVQKAREKGIKDIRLLDRTFNGAGNCAVELLSLFEEFAGDMQFHLEVHPALFTSKLRRKIGTMPQGLLHIEAGVQSLHQNVLDKASRFGKLDDVVDGLKFLCSCNLFEVHSDLIAGLPDYTLSMIYEDVNKLSAIKCDEIQLELLKLLPGTVMRNRAQELEIIYSPEPPYEVMQTPHITYAELQEARRLSRVLDMYYNCEVWQQTIRELIETDGNFMFNFTSYLTRIDMIEQPLSMERRGLLLFEYCKKNYPDNLVSVTESWIKGGLSLKKGAGEGVKAFIGKIPHHIEPFVTDGVRVYSIEVGSVTIWFGFDRAVSHSTPVFIKK